MNYTIFTAPGIDARVAIAVNGTHLAVSFLAKGRSRRADGSYVQRNPDRGALFTHVRERLVGVCAFLYSSRGGKSDSPIQKHTIPTNNAWLNDALAALAKAYSGSGNYRLDLTFAMPKPWTLEYVAQAWGLEPVKARSPGDVRWLL